MRLTLKQLVAPTDGVMRREEIEALVAADVPVAEWPAGELRERVEGLTGGEPLEADAHALAGARGARRAPAAAGRSPSSASTA